MKRKGCSILFVNSSNQVLLFLRDNKPDIPYPDMWDVPGGHVEPGETPEACIIREMKEEMDLNLEGFSLLSKLEFSDRIEYTYWKEEDLDIDAIDLTEGQRLKWFSREEAARTPLAYGFNTIVESFFSSRSR
ncbi:NUDIX hydrolase [bacterium]|nr:NUDIX hydrolase [bacterium]